MKVRHQSVVKNTKIWKSLKRDSQEGGLEFWWDAEMCWCFIHVTFKSRERPEDLQSSHVSQTVHKYIVNVHQSRDTSTLTTLSFS